MVAMNDVRWTQPSAEAIRIDGRKAYMSLETFQRLLEYEPGWALPTRSTVGMMWKCLWDKVWILRYVHDRPQYPTLSRAEIVIVEPEIRETVDDHLL